MKEGYLLLYSESGDEIHVNLISKDDYKKIIKILDSDGLPFTKDQDILKVLYGEDGEKKVLHRWFTQTYCNEKWPYKKTKILGTLCLPQG